MKILLFPLVIVLSIICGYLFYEEPAYKEDFILEGQLPPDEDWEYYNSGTLEDLMIDSIILLTSYEDVMLIYGGDTIYVGISDTLYWDSNGHWRVEKGGSE